MAGDSSGRKRFHRALIIDPLKKHSFCEVFIILHMSCMNFSRYFGPEPVQSSKLFLRGWALLLWLSMAKLSWPCLLWAHAGGSKKEQLGSSQTKGLNKTPLGPCLTPALPRSCWLKMALLSSKQCLKRWKLMVSVCRGGQTGSTLSGFNCLTHECAILTLLPSGKLSKRNPNILVSIMVPSLAIGWLSEQALFPVLLWVGGRSGVSACAQAVCWEGCCWVCAASTGGPFIGGAVLSFSDFYGGSD